MSDAKNSNDGGLVAAGRRHLATAATANSLVSRGMADLARIQLVPKAEERLQRLAREASLAREEVLRAMLDEAKTTGYLTEEQVSDYFGATICRIEEVGPVKIFPDNAVIRGKLDELLVVLEQHGIELISIMEPGMGPSDRWPHAVLFYLRGCRKLDEGAYDDAVKNFDEAIRRCPDDALAYYQRGKVWLHIGDRDKAVKDFDEAIRLDPRNADAYYHRWRGITRARRGDYNDAIKDFDEAIRCDPADSFAYYYLAWLLATCPEKRLRDGERAIQIAEKACELAHWKNSTYWDTLAAAYAEAGKFDEAELCEMHAMEICRGRDQDQFRQRLVLYSQRQPFWQCS